MAMGNQTLGRGKVYFSLFKSGTYTPAGWRYIGNTPEMSLTINNDTLDHFSSDEGIRVKDKSIVLQTNTTGSLTCDDIQPENLALFFFGSADVLSQTSATAETETLTDVVPGMMYQIGVTNATPAGVRSISNVAVTVASASMTAGTDYTVDTELGQIVILEAGSIVDGDDVSITYDRDAKSMQQVISGTQQVEGALKFVATNPQGDKIDYDFPYVRLAPNGDYALKSDDWLALPLSLEILTAPNRAAIYMTGRPYTVS